MRKITLLLSVIGWLTCLTQTGLQAQILAAGKGTFIVFEEVIDPDVTYTISSAPLKNEAFKMPGQGNEFVRRYRDAQLIFGQPVPLTDEELLALFETLKDAPGGARVYQTHPTLLLALGRAAFVEGKTTITEITVEKTAADKTTSTFTLKPVDHRISNSGTISISQLDQDDIDIELALRFPAKHWIDSARVTKQVVGSSHGEIIKPILLTSLQNDSTVMQLWDTSRVVGEFIYTIQPIDKLGVTHNALPGMYANNYNQQTAPRFTDFNVTLEEKTKTVKLSWKTNYVQRVRGYAVYRAVGQEGTFSLLANLPVNETTYMDHVRGSMLEYFYYIQVIDQAGPGEKSLIRFAIPHTKEKPEAPLAISAIPVKGGAQISWPTQDAFYNVQGYYVFRQSIDKKEWELISPFLIRKGESMTWTDTSRFLQPEIEYAYAVKAESSSYILSELSPVGHARPLIARQIAAPTSPGYRLLEDGRLMLYWDDMRKTDPYIASYHIFETDALGKVGKEIVGSPIDDDHQTWQAPPSYKVAPGYVVVAEDAWGNKSAISVVVEPIQQEITVSPENLIVKPIATGYRLHWGKPNPAIVKNIQLFEILNEGKPTLVKSLSATASTYDIAHLKADQVKTYYITYKLLNGKESAASEMVIVR